MTFPRRQHNATVLPDGTVLVLGGTRGGGGFNGGFNDLGPGQPVRAAERWDPETGQWTELASEAVDRCYHATAVLLPDARVLSAGGGEYRPDNVNANDPADSHRNAQLFSPPYLFKGSRPQITSAPASVAYGQSFSVSTPDATDIRKVSWVRLPSVTHSFDENGRIVFLPFAHDGGSSLAITAPAAPNLCPPGHYMLFLVNAAGVPSTAAIVQIRTAPVRQASVREAAAEVAAAASEGAELVASPRGARLTRYLRVYARDAEVARTARGTAVTVGITGTCPYGIGACWGGAYEALGRLEGVALVGPIPNAEDSTAEVFLKAYRLPPLRAWRQQFQAIVNGSYDMRGVEVTVDGVLERRDGRAWLTAARERIAIELISLGAGDKIQWNHTIRQRRPVEPDEAAAFHALLASPERQAVTVTGPLTETDEGYRLHVRQFVRGHR
jgi:hypothetical protein